MAFKFSKVSSFNYSTPQEMYRDNKLKNIMGPIDYQSMMIDKYLEVSSKTSNVALELPTGSGKTLIGLLIGDFRRKHNKERILYLCPTNQLVYQVVEQANTVYGLKAVAFCGKQRDYDPRDKTSYDLCETIGVTTYSSFFSMYSYFKDPDIVILDDVHSSEDYISSNWTISIDRQSEPILFEQIAELLKNEVINLTSYYNLTSNESNADINNWCDMVPMHLLHHKIESLFGILEVGIKSTTPNHYSFNRIKDNLTECNLYIKKGSIAIRPWIPPTLTHSPFRQAKQRIYMSATLGNSGELERITGVPSIDRLPIVDDWDNRGVGRRFFIMPDLVFDEDKYNEIIFSLHNKVGKSVMLVNNKDQGDKIVTLMGDSSPDSITFLAKDIEDSKEEYVKAEKAMVIMANRFDGVDFPDDQSRLLFIYNLPKTTNMQENFLMLKLGASVLFSERIKTRIIQAVGRCTRNPSDYSVVCILGKTILNDLIKKDKLELFPPELRAEIEFGITVSKDYESIDSILENIESFLKRDTDWQEAEQYIVELRNQYIKESKPRIIETYKKLKDAAKLEVEFQYCYWGKNYEECFSIVNSILSNLNEPLLSGYKKYWLYVGSWIAYYLYTNGHSEFEKIGKDLIRQFKHKNFTIRWAGDLISKIYGEKPQDDEADETYFGDIVNKLEANLTSYNTKRKYDKVVDSILDCLNSGGEKFERGHQLLGDLLGYNSKNSTADGAPDPYWIINSKLCIVSEDKIYKSEENFIPIKHVREAMSHSDWIKANEDMLDTDAEIITVFISNIDKIDKEAIPFTTGIYYLNSRSFLEWAISSTEAMRILGDTFVEGGDSNWREKALEKLSDSKTTPGDFIKLIKKRLLSDLELY